MKMYYNFKLLKIIEIEPDHIHLENNIVVRNNEIIKTPLFWICNDVQHKRIMKNFKVSDKKLTSITKRLKRTKLKNDVKTYFKNLFQKKNFK